LATDRNPTGRIARTACGTNFPFVADGIGSTSVVIDRTAAAVGWVFRSSYRNRVVDVEITVDIRSLRERYCGASTVRVGVLMVSMDEPANVTLADAPI
jgi:hypothetical protein